MSQKINPEAKAKIVEALRSGKYKQGRGQLYNSETRCFCVWGVISDVSGVGCFEGELFHENNSNHTAKGMPTPAVMDWVRGFPVFGLDTGVLINCKFETIMEHNDNGATFEQLADAIEEQL